MNFFFGLFIYIYIIFKGVANQIKRSWREQRSTIKFLLAEKGKPCEIFRWKCNLYKEAYFSQKCFFHYDPELNRQYTEWKHTDSPVKKKSGAHWSIKKVIQTVFWDMKGAITIGFLENYKQYLDWQNSLYIRNDLRAHTQHTHIYIYIYIIYNII